MKKISFKSESSQRDIDDAEFKESEEKFELALEVIAANRQTSYKKIRKGHNVN